MTKRERIKPVGQRIYHHDEEVSGPAWRRVVFWRHIGNERLQVALFIYETLEQANNGRIIARAFANYSKELKSFYGPTGSVRHPIASWAGFARRIDYIHTPKGGRRDGSIGNAVSNKIYRHIQNGTLPKDEDAKQRIFDLAGYPWD